LYNSIRQASILDTTLPASARVATLKPEDQINIPGLVCPEDLNNFGRSLGLSYVANTGYINLNLWGQQDLTSQFQGTPTFQWHDIYRVDYDIDGNYVDEDGAAVGTGADGADAAFAVGGGVFWHHASSAEPRVTLDSIGQSDGVTQTLMYAENINANNWASADPDTSCFGIAVDPTQPFTATPATNGALYVTDTSLAATFGNVTVNSQLYQSARINSQPLSVLGTPRPSSSHLGVINVVFCDGSTRSLNETIDISVYVRLLSPDGKRYGQMLVNPTSYGTN
jgi:hypothetical protein